MKNITLSHKRLVPLLCAVSLLMKQQIEITLPDSDGCTPDFLDFLTAAAPGTTWRIVNGNKLQFKPGAFRGGDIKYTGGSITQIILPLLLLGGFTKDGTTMEYTGVTNDTESIDMLKLAVSKVLKLWDVAGTKIDVVRRGFTPGGEGIVRVAIPSIRSIRCINCRGTEPLYKIRGLVVTSKVSAEFTRRCVEVIKKELHGLGSVKVASILNNRTDSGPSPGQECSVYAEGKRGMYYSTVGAKMEPEEVARQACLEMMVNIEAGGLFDGNIMPWILSLLALGQGSSSLSVPKPSPEVTEMLEGLKAVCGITCHFTASRDEWTVTVAGCRFFNPTRPI